MKEIRITLEDNVWKKHWKIKGKLSWKDYLLREVDESEKELIKKFEINRENKK